MLGIDRFFFVDNGSNDGSKELLLAQSDVHVFETNDSYAASKCGVKWLNVLLDRFGSSHWTLTVDADELLVYPLCEEADLKRLTYFLDEAGSDALATFLLDMYSTARSQRIDMRCWKTIPRFLQLFRFDPYIKRFPRTSVAGRGKA